MFGVEDNTYNDIREKSLLQWLEEMEQHEDVAVRCGVRLARDYMEYLKEENEKLQAEVESAQSNHEYIEKLARERLGLIKDGEQVIESLEP